MLLNILNLPIDVKYSEIRDLVRSKCGFDEIILDNLITQDNRTKKITVGLAGEDDAAIFMRKINGVNLNGYRLQVVPKSKIPSLSNVNQMSMDSGLSSYQNVNQQASLWSPGQYYMGPTPLMSNIPTMVPPVSYEDQNMYGMYKPNQNAYAMMNQVGFETNQSNPNMGNQYISYPNYQDYSRNSRENSNQNQEYQSDGFQNNHQQTKQIPVWDVSPGPKWDNNRNPRMDDSDNSRRDNFRSSENDRYRSNQLAGSSRDRDSRYRRNERSPPSSRDRFREVRDREPRYERRSRDDRRDDRREDRSFQDRNNSRRPRSRSLERQDRHAPFPKRPRYAENVTNTQIAFSAAPAASAKFSQEEKQKREIENARSVRGQLISIKAKSLLADKRTKYVTHDENQLLKELKTLIKIRVDELLKNNYTIPLKDMENIYNSRYSFKSHYVLLNEALQKVGGKQLSKAEIEAKRNTMKAPTDPVVKPDELEEIPSAPTKAKKKVARQQQQQKAANQTIQQKNPGSTPLAQIPGRIPQYKDGDKKRHNQEKRELAEELVNLLTDPFQSNSMNSLKPAVQKAINEELDQLTPLVESVCDPPVPDVNNTEKFCETLKAIVPKELVKVLKANLVRRIVPIKPIMVRVFAVPPIKRPSLEIFLKDYDVSAIKKSKQHPYYVATCETVETHDQLCLMKPVLHDSCLLTFKPFHLVEDKKVAKGVALKEREGIRALLKEQTQIPNTNVFEIEDTCTDNFYEDLGATPTGKVKTEDENKSEALCQEMKDLFEQINNTDQGNITNDNAEIKNDENENAEIKNEENVNEQPKEENYESPLKACEGEKETQDVKPDVIENINEEIDNDCLLVVEDKVGEKEKEIMMAQAEDIGWADVNDEDLEDW